MRTADVIRAELEQSQAEYVINRRANDADYRRVQEIDHEIRDHHIEVTRLDLNRSTLLERISERETNKLGTEHITALMDELARAEAAETAD